MATCAGTRANSGAGIESPRAMPAMTGETNKHVVAAVLSLVKELNLDGLLCVCVCSSDVVGCLGGAG